MPNADIHFDKATSIDGHNIQIIKSPISGVQYYDAEGILSPFNEITPYDSVPAEDFKIKIEQELTEIGNFDILPTFYARNLSILTESFNSELKKKQNLNNADIAGTTFTMLVSYFSELPFEKAAIEITKSNSIKFSFTFPNNFLLIVSKPFEKLDDVLENDIIFSIFIKRKLIASNILNIQKFFEGLTKFLHL